MTDDDRLRETAHRLEQMGIYVRSAELAERAQQIREFKANDGNRAMRRARKRATRRRGK